MCLFHPTRVGAVAGVCTPYTPPWQKYLSLEELVERLPHFSYQLFLASPAAAPELENDVRGRGPRLRVGRRAASRASTHSPLSRGPGGERAEAEAAQLERLFRAVHRSSEPDDALDLAQDVAEAPSFLNRLGNPPRSPMISAAELAYYVQMYQARGAQGGLNWYRTRRICFDEERDLPRTINHLALMVRRATRHGPRPRETTVP